MNLANVAPIAVNIVQDIDQYKLYNEVHICFDHYGAYLTCTHTYEHNKFSYLTN